MLDVLDVRCLGNIGFGKNQSSLVIGSLIYTRTITARGYKDATKCVVLNSEIY